MSEDLGSKFAQELLIRELEIMELKYGPKARIRMKAQHYLYAQDFKDEASGDTKNKGAPVLAYSFLGYGMTHHPTGDPGTRYPMNVVVYGFHDDLLPMLQHLHAKKQSQAAVWIGLETFNNVHGDDAERKTRYVFIFYGAMVYNLASTGYSYIIFYDTMNYEITKIVSGDQETKGTIMIRCADKDNPAAKKALDDAAKASAA